MIQVKILPDYNLSELARKYAGRLELPRLAGRNGYTSEIIYDVLEWTNTGHPWKIFNYYILLNRSGITKGLSFGAEF